jgi:hypothetical protein
MTLSSHELIRRFLMHVLPGGFHRIRHYGLVASGSRAVNIARARELLAVPLRCEQQDTSGATAADEPRMLPRPCPCCGGRMFIIETFARGSEPKHRPTPKGGNPKPFTKPKIAGIPISVSSAVARLRYSYWPLRRYFHMFASYKQSRGTVKLVSTCLRRIP